MSKMATEAQISYCRRLFNINENYVGMNDDAIKTAAGFDLANLTHDDVQNILKLLNPLSHRKQLRKYKGRLGNGHYNRLLN